MASLVQVPIEAISGASNFRCVSPFGDFLVITHDGAGGGSFLKLVDGEYVLQTAPVEFVGTGTKYNALFSPNGQYLAVSNSAAPYLHIYKCTYDGGVIDLELLPSPATMPSGQPLAMDWSPDGNFLVVGNTTTPRILAYLVDYGTDTFTNMTIPSVINAEQIGLQFSYDSQFLYTLNQNASNQVRVYRAYSGETPEFSYVYGTSPTGYAAGIQRFLIAGRNSYVFYTGAGVSSPSANRGDFFRSADGTSYNSVKNLIASAPAAGVYGVQGTFLEDDVVLLRRRTTFVDGFTIDDMSLVAEGTISALINGAMSGTPNNFRWGKRGSDDYLGIASQNAPSVFTYPSAPIEVEGEIGYPTYRTEASGSLSIVAEGEMGYPSYEAEGSALVDIVVTGEIGYPTYGMTAIADEIPFEPIESLPIIVSGAIIEVDTRGIEVSSEEAPPFAYGEMGYPSYGMEGLATQPVLGSGEMRYPTYGVSSLVFQDVNAEGEMGYPAYRTEAEAEFPEFPAIGVMAYPAYGTTGEVELPIGILGSIGYPTYGTEGTVDVPIAVTGSMGYPTYEMSGSATWVSAEGDMGYPTYRISGVVETPIEVLGEIGYPTYRTVAEASNIGGFGVMGYPAYRMEGEVQGISAQGEMGYPAYRSEGLGYTDRTIEGEMGYPAYRMQGEMIRTLVVDVLMGYPAYRMSGEGNYTYVITGEMGYPAYRMRGHDGGVSTGGAVSVELMGSKLDLTFNISANVHFGFGKNLVIG